MKHRPLARRTQCSGQRNDGQRCTHIKVEAPELLWWCRHHAAQDGKKRLVSAVAPLWAISCPGNYDDWDDEYGIIPREY